MREAGTHYVDGGSVGRKQMVEGSEERTCRHG